MKYLFFFLFLISSYFACAQSNVTHTIFQDTIQRSFLVHLPTGYQPGTPVSCVFVLHGSGATALQQQVYSKMDNIANANGFIVVYPSGINNTWLVGTAGTYTSSSRDVEFIGAVLDTLLSLYAIKTDRVYACGLSQGGYMSHRLACDLQDRFAAIASVAGGISDSSSFYCSSERSVPVLLIHGTDDPYVPYSWAERSAEFWVTKNECAVLADTSAVNNSNTTDNSTVQRIVYSNCSNEVTVEMFRIDGGGHTWPGSAVNLPGYGATNHDISASSEIWKFFNRFTLNGTTVSTDKIVLQDIVIYPNPVQDILNIDGISGDVSIRIFNNTGTLIREVHNTSEIQITDFQSGIYFLQCTSLHWQWIQKFVKE